MKLLPCESKNEDEGEEREMNLMREKEEVRDFRIFLKISCVIILIWFLFYFNITVVVLDY